MSERLMGAPLDWMLGYCRVHGDTMWTDAPIPEPPHAALARPTPTPQGEQG